MAFIKVRCYDYGQKTLNTDQIASVDYDRENNVFVTMTDGAVYVVEYQDRGKLKDAMEDKPVKKQTPKQTPWKIYKKD